jgi:hypothetical protein
MAWTWNGDVTNGANLEQIEDGDIHIHGKIEKNCTVVLVSNRGSITIDGKVDDNCNVSLTAAGDIRIGVVGGEGDRKIDGHSHVDATAGGEIVLGDKIDGDRTSVDFIAGQGITIVSKIDGGAKVRLLSGSGSIKVGGNINNENTHVLFHPPNSLEVAGGTGDAQVRAEEWATSAPLRGPQPRVSGHWWQNWPQTFGYVSPPRVVPRSVDGIVKAIQQISAPAVRVPGRIKAVGGGWSFTDAALPFKTQVDVDRASTLLRGAHQKRDLRHVLEGLNDVTSSLMDTHPAAVAENLEVSRRYDQPSMTQLTDSGINLPGTDGVLVMDTRSLGSSLHESFHEIVADEAKQRADDGTVLFHVEAGITIADLNQLLDHQKPRLAIQASGGSPGATLAGTISTATHGGEFRWPLLVDRVRAVHLVGPGGEQWWIEGKQSVANPAAVQKRYPEIDAAHFIGRGWNGIDGLTAQDVLEAVVVSMGTMGVIYSVVLEVVPQFGLQQIVNTTTWSGLLKTAGTSEAELRQGNAAANQKVLKFMLDGKLNGTRIAQAENVYTDLAINPINQDCWITNRRVTPHLPVDANSPPVTIGDYLAALTKTVGAPGHAVNRVLGDLMLGRVFDFLSYATDVENPVDGANDISQAIRLFKFLTSFPDVLTATVAAMNAQAVANGKNAADHPARGQMFLGDLLTGFLHALQGTWNGGKSDRTDVSYKVGAIGWPDGGVPGRALEIALAPSVAFSFLQTVLFDEVLRTVMVGRNKPLIGYISIRVCPSTKTLMGMQRFAPYSVMIEIVGYRSPEANVVMDAIQKMVLTHNAKSKLGALLHWGLENQLMTATDLEHTPLREPIRPNSPFTNLSAFKAVRRFLRKDHSPVFDNNFVRRLDL